MPPLPGCASNSSYASVILNGPDQSPYVLGYLCYLADIPFAWVTPMSLVVRCCPTIYVPLEKRAREGVRKRAGLCSLGQSLIRTLTFPLPLSLFQNLTSPLPLFSPWLSFSLALFLPAAPLPPSPPPPPSPPSSLAPLLPGSSFPFSLPLALFLPGSSSFSLAPLSPWLSFSLASLSPWLSFSLALFLPGLSFSLAPL